MFKTVLVVAAHPDDETLGCGGTISRLAKLEGATVHVAYLSDGVSSRADEVLTQEKNLKRRQAAAKKACKILGVKSVSFDVFPDNRMDTVALLEVAKVIESLVKRYMPDVIFTHHAGDVNVDHRVIHEAVVIACRPQVGNPVKTILCFEVPSSTEWQLSGARSAFTPNWFFDISSTLNDKLAALESYADEIRTWPHPRSLQGIEHLACWRGSTVGVDAAEAFMLGRQLQ